MGESLNRHSFESEELPPVISSCWMSALFRVPKIVPLTLNWANLLA